MSLTDLVFAYCEQQNLWLEKADIERLNYIISNGKENIGIMVRDWNRALGYNVVIQAERIKKDNKQISQVIILTNSYSDPAKSLADKINIPLLRGWEPFKLLSNTG